MDRRLNLHHLLKQTFEEATGQSSNKRVFYQPGSDTTLTFPCIVYKLSDIPFEPADNWPYMVHHQYELTVIDRDPLSPLREKVALLPMCSVIRIFESDNLHHYVFRIYD